MYLNLQHCRALGYCLWGVRRFCTRYGLDFKKLAKGEMPAEEFTATGEGLALRLVKHAESLEEKD